MPRKYVRKNVAVKPSGLIPAIDQIEQVTGDAEAQLQAIKSNAHRLLDEAEQHAQLIQHRINQARRRVG